MDWLPSYLPIGRMFALGSGLLVHFVSLRRFYETGLCAVETRIHQFIVSARLSCNPAACDLSRLFELRQIDNSRAVETPRSQPPKKSKRPVLRNWRRLLFFLFFAYF